ncbi:MAG TPA: hypothetical protein VML50_06615 [Anaeromyxobacter sp.]|nr:hypothetical protein [Anaeromyxobacter sp.]
MKTRALPALFLAAAAALACTDNRMSVEPFGLCSPPTDATQCTFASTCSSYVLGSLGLFLRKAQNLDGSGPTVFNELVTVMQFNNQMLNTADETAGRTNANDAYIREWRLSFDLVEARDASGTIVIPAGGLAIPDASVSTQGATVPANGSATTFATIIPLDTDVFLSNALATFGAVTAKVNAHLRASGITNGGAFFETGDYLVPVDISTAIFGGYACTPATDVPVAVCPNSGQTASFACATP